MNSNNINNNSDNQRPLNESDNPFRKSAVMVRSPEQNLVEQVEEQRSKTESPSAITKLGELISSLMEFVKTKNNVHHTIKEQIRKIRVTYNMALDELRGEKMDASQKAEQATQTSPKLPKPNGIANKRSREQNEETPKTKIKKRKKQPANLEVEENGPAPVQQGQENIRPSPNWTKVEKRKKTQQKKTRPNAIIISANGETTYADILRKIKADPCLQDFGGNVRKIRRTQKGELLLEINASSKEETGKFNELVGKTLEGRAEIRARVSETLIECKDLDEVTTEDDICAALEEQLSVSGLGKGVVKNMRKAYGGTQIAKISLPDTLAQRLLEMGKVRVGWSICRVRKSIVLKRCFRCLEFGHIAGVCKSSFDRSKLCRKCGEANHIAKDCTSNPKCMFCVANKLDHIAGSSKCPTFRKALSSRHR